MKQKTQDVTGTIGKTIIGKKIFLDDPDKFRQTSLDKAILAFRNTVITEGLGIMLLMTSKLTSNVDAPHFVSVGADILSYGYAFCAGVYLDKFFQEFKPARQQFKELRAQKRREKSVDNTRSVGGLAALVASAFVSLAPQPANADYVQARRIPTGCQLLNITQGEVNSEQDTQSFTHTVILKYYTPDTGFILAVPGVYRTTPQREAYGLGDIALKVTHVFDPVQGLGVAPYTTTQFPTGAFNPRQKVNVGTGNFAQTFGSDVTYNWRQLELDAVLAYTFTMPNPKTGVDPGDNVRGSLSVAYADVGTLWAGIEGVVQRSWSARKFGQQVMPGQHSIAVGPETRFKVVDGVLVQLGAKAATNGTYSGEMRVFYNF